ELKRTGGVSDDDITVDYVPGAVGLPLAAKRIAAKKEYAALIELGVVIRGGTPHFDLVSGESIKGLANVS
ncbi:6,7-dimethyl-8-ribityllumazine synthase, partial [Pseudoalteromonas agarivorans]|uniref:6,7-dimethyl-8-ribityllumazine synthase n=1 Tax=Pseudoalteromonas agarivorans TaxID=176102 RepID=UPI00312024A0